MTWEISPDDANKILFATGLVTFILSSIIVLCTVVNESIRSKLFPRIVAWISFCEMMGSLAILFGVQKQEAICSLQSGLFMFFERAGWNWTVILAYQLDGLVTRKSIPLNEWQMHLITWSISFLFEFIPYMFSMRYGSDDDSTICSGLHFHRYVTEMIAVIFTGYLLLIILILLFLNFRLFYNLKITGNDKLISVAQTLRRYPVSLILFWVPNMVISTIGNAGGPDGYERFGLISILVVSLALGILYGAGVAGLYIYSYNDSIMRWARSRFMSNDNNYESNNESQDFVNGATTTNNSNNNNGNNNNSNNNSNFPTNIRASQSMRDSNYKNNNPTESSRSYYYDFIDQVDIVDYDRSELLGQIPEENSQNYDQNSGLSRLTANSSGQDDSPHTSLLRGADNPNSNYYIGRI